MLTLVINLPIESLQLTAYLEIIVLCDSLTFNDVNSLIDFSSYSTCQTTRSFVFDINLEISRFRLMS